MSKSVLQSFAGCKIIIAKRLVAVLREQLELTLEQHT